MPSLVDNDLSVWPLNLNLNLWRHILVHDDVITKTNNKYLSQTMLLRLFDRFNLGLGLVPDKVFGGDGALHV